MNAWIGFFISIFTLSAYAINSDASEVVKKVQLAVEVVSFEKNSAHYSMQNGQHYFISHNTIYVYGPENYKGMRIKVRHDKNVEIPQVWSTVGGTFQVLVPEVFVRESWGGNSEIEAGAFVVLTDQSGRSVSINYETSSAISGAENSNLLIRAVVESYDRNAEKFYYLNGVHDTNHITRLRVESPSKHKGKILIVYHSTDAGQPKKIWTLVGGSIDAWVNKSYLEGQDKRIDWRALKLVPR